MATGINISKYIYNELNESQIYTWRNITYNNLEKYHKFTKNDLYNFPFINIPCMSDLLNELYEDILEKIITGELEYSENTFIMIDSSTICNLSIHDIISNIYNLYPNIKKTNLIILYSCINKAENNYKKTTNYPGVNYNLLNHNLHILNNKILNNNIYKNVIILNTNLYLENKILINEEKKYLNKYNQWLKGSKNEINDNAQIKLMTILLSKFINFKGIFISHDRGLCNKLKHISSTEPRLLYIFYKT